jgi:hypothetical protein
VFLLLARQSLLLLFSLYLAMNKFLALLAAVGLLATQTACKRHQESVAVLTPTPGPVSTSVNPPLPTRHLAPAGTFFLTERVSIATQFGVKGIAPGSRVTFVRANEENFNVTDGETEFTVKKSQLTNDLDQAKAMATADHAMQVQATRSVEQQKNEIDRRKAEERAGLAQQQAQKNKSRPKSPVPTPYNNPLESRAYNATSAKKHTDAQGRVYWIDIWGHRHYEN